VADAGHHLARDVRDGPPGRIDFPNTAAPENRFEEDHVGRLRDHVLLPFEPRTATALREPPGELIGPASEDDDVSEGKEMREVADHEVHPVPGVGSPKRGL